MGIVANFLLAAALASSTAQPVILVVWKEHCDKRPNMDIAVMSAEECTALKRYAFTASDGEDFQWIGCFETIPDDPDELMAQLDKGVILHEVDRKPCGIVASW